MINFDSKFKKSNLEELYSHFSNKKSNSPYLAQQIAKGYKSDFKFIIKKL